jgi:hypothetical protein
MASSKREILTPYGQPSRSIEEIRAAIEKVAGQFSASKGKKTARRAPEGQPHKASIHQASPRGRAAD